MFSFTIKRPVYIYTRVYIGIGLSMCGYIKFRVVSLDVYRKEITQSFVAIKGCITARKICHKAPFSFCISIFYLNVKYIKHMDTNLNV